MTRSSLLNALMLTPLIGATHSWMPALGVWLIFVVVSSAFGLAMAGLRNRLVPASRLIAAVILAATLTSCMQLAMQAWALQWHQQIGLYSGLIALQCVVLEHTGFHQRPWRDRLRQGAVFGALMVGLGLLRELLGDSGLRLATLAPGGFILLGLLIAAWQAWARPMPSN
jgi:Na+-translocating ferredoxin:NAD+ oxidoreductase subunit E